jgi:Tfp pilus assembly protein PilF
MAHYNLGLLYQDKGDTVNATQAFHTALQHHPQHGRHNTTQGETHIDTRTGATYTEGKRT